MAPIGDSYSRECRYLRGPGSSGLEVREKLEFALAKTRMRRAVHVHLVGCNGVPSACYAPLLQRPEHLSSGDRLDHLPGGDGRGERRAGSRPRRLRVTSTSFSDVHKEAGHSWEGAINKIEADVARVRARVGPDTPVVGFGHSMGGAMIYAAATRQCGFSWISLYDPPMFRPLLRLGMLGLRRSGLWNAHPLVRSALRKPAAFCNRSEAHEYVDSRRLYGKLFAPEVRASFKEHGIVATDPEQRQPPCDESGPVAFAFTPEQERLFYVSTPSELFARGSVLGKLIGDTSIGQYDASRCPGELIFSSRHEFLAAADVQYLRGVLRCSSGVPFRFVPKDAGHFHPLCDPDDVADWITMTEMTADD